MSLMSRESVRFLQNWIESKSARLGRGVSLLALSVLGLGGLATSAEAADPVAVGPQILVAPGFSNFYPRVASDPAGNFMVVWEDEDEALQARRWFATGNESFPQLQVSAPNYVVDTGGSQSTGNSSVAADAAGNFMITYTAGDGTRDEPPCEEDDPCLFLKRQDANGVVGPTFLLQDPLLTYVEEDQVSNPEVAALGNGDFIVLWEGYDLTGDESTFAIRTASTGQPKGSYFRVNDTIDFYQGQYGEFGAASDAEGNFVVVFRDESDYDFPGGTTHAQLFNDKWKEVGTEFGVSSENEEGRNLDVASTPDGTFMVISTHGDLIGRIFNGDGSPVTDDFLIDTDGSYPRVAASDESFVVVWGFPDISGQRFDKAGNALSTVFPVGTGAQQDVAAAANGDFVVTWLNSQDDVVAQRFQAETPVEQEIGVLGKSLLISNKVPDDPEKNRVKWKSGGPELVAPLRGTASDPRCNGDPIGTVKATVEFRSASSGHASGVIDLPCQNWLAVAGTTVKQVSTRTYSYRDSQLDQGPCSSIVLKSGKSLTVTCKGSGETTDFPYDLVVGTSEGTVHAILDMGLFKYCASFPPSGSANGSNGKTFKGVNAPIAGCPP